MYTMIKHKKRFTSLWMTLFLSCIVLVSSVDAKRPKRKKYEPVSAVMKDLKWGIGHQDVFSYLDKRIKARYDQLVTQMNDDLKIDALRKDQRLESKSLRQNYVTFTGQRTGYEVSVVQNDFAHNNSETMLKVDEGTRQLYYFFRYDRLWKIMVVYYSDSIEGGFRTFVKQIRRKYGKPKKKNWETPYGGSRRLVEAIWRDDQTELVLEDRSAFYSRYVMKMMSVLDGKEIQELHENRKKRAEETKQANKKRTSEQKLGEIDIFTADQDEGDIIDKLTGTQHKVDLNRIKEVPVEE